MSGELNFTFLQGDGGMNNDDDDDAAFAGPDHELFSDEDNYIDQLVESNGARTENLNLLKSSLGKRISELEDVDEQLSASANLDQLCSSIEKESWNLWDSLSLPLDRKYHNHMDALLFNINDKSNGDFFRAILLGNKTPSEIARLKPADMASDAKKKKRQFIDEPNKSLCLHVSEAFDVCKMKTTTKPIVKTHKSFDFKIKQPPTDEMLSSWTSEFFCRYQPENYRPQTVSPSKGPTNSKPNKTPLSNGCDSVAKKKKIFPVLRSAHTSEESFSNYYSPAGDNILSNVVRNHQSFTFGSSLETPHFRSDYQLRSYQSTNVQPQPSFSRNVYQNIYIEKPILVNQLPPARFSQPKFIAPPSPGSYSYLKMRLSGIVAKYAEMRKKANCDRRNSSALEWQPTSPPSTSTSKAPVTFEMKTLSRCHMMHVVPNVKSCGVLFEVLVYNMYGNLAERNIFEDKIWRKLEGMVVEEHVPPAELMSHLEFCLTPACPREIRAELAVVSIHLVKASQSQVYEDLFSSLDASGMLGQLSYKHNSADNAFQRRVYIYALNKHREVHSPLKALIGSALSSNEQRGNMLLGIIVLMQNI